MNLYSLYLKIIRMSEKYLIKKGLFRLALIALIVNNIIIITVSKVKPRMFSKENSEYSDFVKIELDFILKELFYKTKEIKSEPSMESKILKLFSSLNIWASPCSLDKLIADRILIVGPGEFNYSEALNHDLEILLDPRLINIKYKEDMRYVIVLNKACTQRDFDLIFDHASNIQVEAILTKKWFPEFGKHQNIFLFDPSDLIRLAPISGAPNLLPIILVGASKWAPKSIQILGCDFYLGKNNYRLNEKPDEVVLIMSSKPAWLDSLSLHNPFTQLSFLKTFNMYFKSKGIDFITSLSSLNYLEMANRYNQKYSRKSHNY